MYSIILTEDAVFDILTATNYYEHKSPGLGDKFWDRIDQTCHFIRLQPLAWPEKLEGTREIKIKGFPFVIIYKLENAEIFVLRVFPCKMDPVKKTKKRRI